MLGNWKRRNKATASPGGHGNLPSSPASKYRTQGSRRNICALIVGLLFLAWVFAYAQSHVKFFLKHEEPQKAPAAASASPAGAQPNAAVATGAQEKGGSGTPAAAAAAGATEDKGYAEELEEELEDEEEADGHVVVTQQPEESKAKPKVKKAARRQAGGLNMAQQMAHTQGQKEVHPLADVSSLEGALQPDPPPAAPPQPPPNVEGRTCGPLTKELLSEFAVRNTVMITMADALMINLYASSWQQNLAAAGITYWVLAVSDQKAAEAALAKGLRQCFMVHEMEVEGVNGDFKWGSNVWRLHTWQKVLVVRHVHQLGFHVVHSDIDTVWFRDPLPYFHDKYKLGDYMVSLDPITTQNPIGDDAPEKGITVGHYMNTGVYFLRQTPGGSALINKWYEIRKEMQGRNFHDQDGLYKYLTTIDKEEIDYERRAAHVVNKTVWLQQLPATQFQNAYSHCINQVHQAHGLMPYEVHMVWTWGANYGKIHRMREKMYFFDPPHYYLDGRYLSMDIQFIPTPVGFNEWRDIRNDTEKMVQHHLRSLQTQLSEFYAGLAIARALGRIVILPKMLCWCIQNWFENPLCRLPGDTMTHFPMTCPADYVFNLEKLLELPVKFREHSFLENVRTDESIKAPPVVVRARPGVAKPVLVAVDPDQHDVAVSGDAPEASHLVHMPPGTKLNEIVSSLARLRHAKRIHLVNPKQLFGGFPTEAGKQEYEQMLDGVAIRWCCRPYKVTRELKKEEFFQVTITQDGKYDEGPPKEWPPEQQH